MLRKIGIGLGAAGILATTLSISGNSVGAAPEGRLRVIAVSDEEGFQGDGGVGSTFAFSGDLYSFRRDDRMSTATKREPIGRFGVSCVLTSVENDEANCSASLDIDQRRGDDGQITIQGLVSETGDEAAGTMSRDRDRGFELAITGGTDDFSNAGGTVTVFDVSDRVEILSFDFDD